jgi:hypothetical protein
MQSTEKKQDSVEQVPFILSGLSFIPCLGIPFGLVAFVWGIVSLTQKKRGGVLLTVVSAVGIFITIVILAATMILPPVMSSALNTVFTQSGVMNTPQALLAETGMNSLVQAIEFYKLQNGHYPEVLEDLLESSNYSIPVNIYDTSTYFEGNSNLRTYFYQVTADGDAYFLLSVGPDGKPFTADDIVPSIDLTNTGLKIDPRSR